MEVSEAVRKSNKEVGRELIEWSGAEEMVRAHGYIRSKSDLEQIVLKSANGTPVRLADVADVQLGPELRRGIAELDGRGEVAGGVVVMRHGENAMNVIGAVKQRLAQIQPSLPKGVQVVTTYDRPQLIKESIHTLSHELLIEMLIVSLVILIFLWHIPSALIPIFTLPAAVILSFIPMRMFGINANIMSLGGIAVAIGALVDAAVVVVENSHKKLEAWESGGRQGDYKEVLITAIQEVGRPSFFSLLVIALSFMPIFALEAQEGNLFKPLAFTKNFSMIIAALLAITLDPALRLMFTRFKAEGERQKAEGPFRRITSAFRLLTSAFRFKAEGGRQKAEGPFRRITSAFRLLTSAFLPEERHPISRILFRIYGPPIHWVLRHTRLVIVIALVIVAITIPVYFQLGHEFMPPLNEGVILYMPTTLPGISVTEASALLQKQDALLREVPEIERVFGKAGRADTSTDPAPLSMMETTIVLKPESQWRSGMTYDRLINELDRKLQFPGQTNAWTMPIRNRIDMLTTGIRTPVGIKVYGADLKQIENIGRELERIVGRVPGTRRVFGERVSGGYFVDFDIDRAAIARYGLTIDDVQQTIMTAIGGGNVSTTIEGRERYPINIRYPRELRDEMDKLGRVLVATSGGAQIPLAQLATLRIVEGPAMIRDESGRLAGYVYIDVDTARRDLGSFVDDAKQAVASQLHMPAGYTMQWSGQYEAMERVRQRMLVVVPLTLFVVAFLIYLNTRSMPKTLLVLLAVPFSAVGAVWLLWALGYNMSIGVWVGLIALLGLDAETGIFMLLYLDLAYDEMRPRSREELREAIYHGAVKRVRPKVMTVACAFFGLVPIMWSTGAGADVMKRIAAPMIGGLFTSFLMELLVYPAIYYRWKWRSEVRHVEAAAPRRELAAKED